MHYFLGTLGFGAILTSSRNSLPKEIKSEFLHKEKTDPKNKAAKVARFAQSTGGTTIGQLQSYHCR